MLSWRTVGDGGPVVLVSERLESDGFLVAFSERGGGVSEHPFATLNLGFGTGDERERVLANRRRLCGVLGIPEFACARQVHGSRVASVGRSDVGAGFADPGTAIGDADALMVSMPGAAVAVLVADCVPLALANLRDGTLVAVHAGWRGLAEGVVPAAVAALGDPRAVLASIGPAVGPDHYEVAEDVAAAVARGTDGAARVRRSGRRVRLDLGATVEVLLTHMGVRDIERVEVCTACEPDRFFSRRRDGRSGRQALVAARLA